jgi:Helix-turn-helix domain
VSRALRFRWVDAVVASTLPQTAKHLAHVLTLHMDDAGYCWPGRELLAREMGADPRTVDRAATRLEQDGWIRWKRSKGRRSHEYWATFPNVGTVATLERRQKVDVTSAESPANVGTVPANVGRESTEPTKNHPPNPPPNRDGSGDGGEHEDEEADLWQLARTVGRPM